MLRVGPLAMREMASESSHTQRMQNTNDCTAGLGGGSYTAARRPTRSCPSQSKYAARRMRARWCSIRCVRNWDSRWTRQGAVCEAIASACFSGSAFGSLGDELGVWMERRGRVVVTGRLKAASGPGRGRSTDSVLSHGVVVNRKIVSVVKMRFLFRLLLRALILLVQTGGGGGRRRVVVGWRVPCWG